jgi:hypothetical protein
MINKTRRNNMTIYDFINKIDSLPINDKFTRQIEQLYETELNAYVKKILSFDSDGVFFENDDILRLLAHKEIVNAVADLSVDFTGMKLIPVFDTGDNDYIVFDTDNNCWSKFNIVDSVKFKQRQSLSEFFG